MTEREKLLEGLTGWLIAALVTVAFLLLLLVFLFGSNLAVAANAAQIVGLISVVISLGALIYARNQIKDARNTQAKNFAQDLYRDYLKLAFENPVLADPSDKLAEFDYDKGTIGGSKEAYAKYQWFLSFVLDTCEQLAKEPLSSKARPASKKLLEGEFGETVVTQLEYHREWLSRQWDKDKEHGYLSQFEENQDYIELIGRIIGKKA